MKDEVATELFDLDSVMLDVEAIEEGRWVPLGPDFPGVEIFTCGLTAKAPRSFQTFLERSATRKERDGRGRLTSEAQDRILKEVVIEKCITNWRGFSQKGKEVPFSKEFLRFLVTDPKAKRVAAAFILAITDLEQQVADTEAAVEKN